MNYIEEKHQERSVLEALRRIESIAAKQNEQRHARVVWSDANAEILRIARSVLRK